MRTAANSAGSGISAIRRAEFSKDFALETEIPNRPTRSLDELGVDAKPLAIGQNCAGENCVHLSFFFVEQSCPGYSEVRHIGARHRVTFRVRRSKRLCDPC